MEVMVDGKALTAADVLRLGRQLEAAMELEEVAAIQAQAEAWARAFHGSRTLTHNELKDVAHRAQLALEGKPREPRTFAPPAWPSDGPPVVTPAIAALLAQNLGVSTDDAARHIRPSLLLWPSPVDAFDLPPGATHLGGAPDVPDGWEWPCRDGFPLAFLAQIDLADLAAAMPGAGGPTTGLLLFFGDVDAGAPDGWRVEHVPAGTPLSKAAYPADLYRICRYAPVAVELVPDLTAPSDRADLAPALGELFGELEGGREDETLHRAFGYPQQAQAPYMKPDHVLLLQLDSDFRLASPPNHGFFWGQGGRLAFTMPRADWEAGRFDRVEGAIASD